MIEMKLKLMSFEVPTKVVVAEAVGQRQDGFHSVTVSLEDVPEEALSALCDEFRSGVFAAAGKCDPRLTDKEVP
jgi:hypothetical protein